MGELLSTAATLLGVAGVSFAVYEWLMRWWIGRRRISREESSAGFVFGIIGVLAGLATVLVLIHGTLTEQVWGQGEPTASERIEQERREIIQRESGWP